MLSRIFVVAIVHFIFFVQQFNCQSHIFLKRGLSEDVYYNSWGAILAKNGEPTTCEIGLSGLSAGMVSANCFDFTDNSTLSQDTKYEAYLYNGNLDSKPVVYTIDIDDIHIHPQFSQSTLVYNIAVVEFNKNAINSEKTYLNGNSYSVDSSSYTQRFVSSNTSNWNTPQLTDQQDDLYQTCDSVGGLYKPNLAYMSCNSKTLSSTFNNKCNIPYSALYTSVNKKLVLVGLYSYSIILGTDACKDTCISFYTYVANYVPYMAKTLGRPVDIAFGSDITNSSAIIWDDLVVNPPNYVDMTGRLRIGGNLYSDLESEPSSSATSSNTPTDTPSSEPDRSASSGLGSTTKIIIGVVVPVAAIILAACVFIVCRVLNKKRADTNWRPQAEELHLREIANDLVVDDSVQPPNLRPPPYSASHGTRPPIRQSTVTTATMSSIAEEETSISEFERHDADNHDKK